MTNELPTYPSEDVAGFRKAVVALARMGVVPKVRLLSTTYRLPNGDGTYGDLHATRRTALIVWHREEAGGEIEESYVSQWVPEDLAPYIDRLFVFGAQEYEPDETPYTGETPFSLRLAMDLFAVTCDRWTAPIFGAPLDEIDRCVRIMNKKGRLVCHCN